MKKSILKPDSPEFRDVVRRTTGLKLSLPSLTENEERRKSVVIQTQSSLPPLNEAIKTLPKLPEARRNLTGLKDVDREILKHLDDRDLLTACSIDKRMWNEVCDDNFLQRRLQRYPGIEKYKKDKESWKEFFLRVIYYVSKLKDEYEFTYSFGDFRKQYELLKNYTGERLLSKAVEMGELALVKHLAKKENLNTLNRYLLVAASRFGHLDIVKYLVEIGFDLNSATGSMASYTASENGYLDIIKFFAEIGADLHTGNEPVLRVAGQKGHSDIVKFLVERGANIHVDREYPLTLAIEKGNLDLVKFLVEHGANYHNDGDFPLRLANHYGRKDIVKYLENLP